MTVPSQPYAVPDPDDASAALSGRPRIAPVPTASAVAGLQALRGYPCVSLLLNTTPSERMTTADGTRLRGLATDAVRRLRALPDTPARDEVLGQLADVTAQAAAGPTHVALAVYAGAGTTRVVPLPVPVRERVVLDHTFATRDLVRALHRTPRHSVLILSAEEARLFTGMADQLAPALGSAFPLRPGGRSEPTGRREGRRTGRPDGSRPALKEADQGAFLRRVDQALGAHLCLNPSPLVVVGPDRLLSMFRNLSRNLARLAGTVSGNHLHTSLPDLVHRIRPVLDSYLHSRQDEALNLLERRAGAHRVVSGMQDAWLAATRERPEMLAVEDTLFYPARLEAGGDLLVPAEDVESPDVIDDAVDEIIELVLHRGGWVALIDEGRLAGHQGVALTLRGSD